MNDYQLGQKVAYTTHIERRSSRPGEFTGPERLWSTKSGPGMPDRPAGEGIIVGKRTLTNGDVDYDRNYFPTERFAAYLVAFDLRRKPVYVLPEHIIGYWGEKS